ncbi:hypothetical protein N7495_002412 [Penicillium taxi]|uniref:uncharacterized protein n=1 Tax=Penicillium taxi TaxID=168475 RepID=UPI0025458D2A|nr:uncharacterized protein N7495_002412 [Penicillium taxi]KAJ5901884.1 hypothetical protein N7495_002412 [Penicillium taxi]
MHVSSTILALGLSASLVSATAPLFGVQQSGENCVIRADNFATGCSGTSAAFAKLSGIDCTADVTNLNPTICGDGSSVLIEQDGDDGFNILMLDSTGNPSGYCYVSDLITGSSCDATATGYPSATATPSHVIGK